MKCLKVTIRSSHPEMFYGKDFLKNIAKVSGKQLCRSLFLVKCQTGGLQAYLKRDFDADFFSVNVEEFSCRFIFASHFFNISIGLNFVNWLPVDFQRRFIFTNLRFIKVLYTLIFCALSFNQQHVSHGTLTQSFRYFKYYYLDIKDVILD